MIRREDGELVALCDCGEEFAGGVLEWDDFLASLREEGWRITKDDGEWIHTCPTCQEE